MSVLHSVCNLVEDTNDTSKPTQGICGKVNYNNNSQCNIAVVVTCNVAFFFCSLFGREPLSLGCTPDAAWAGRSPAPTFLFCPRVKIYDTENKEKSTLNMQKICAMKMSDFFAGISEGVITRLFAKHNERQCRS